MNASPEPVQQRAAEQDRDPAGAGVGVDVGDVRLLDVGRVEHQLAVAVGGVDEHAVQLEQAADDLDVADLGHVAQPARLLAEHDGHHRLRHEVLGPPDLDVTDERGAAVDDEGGGHGPSQTQTPRDGDGWTVTAARRRCVMGVATSSPPASLLAGAFFAGADFLAAAFAGAFFAAVLAVRLRGRRLRRGLLRRGLRRGAFLAAAFVASGFLVAAFVAAAFAGVAFLVAAFVAADLAGAAFAGRRLRRRGLRRSLLRGSLGGRGLARPRPWSRPSSWWRPCGPSRSRGRGDLLGGCLGRRRRGGSRARRGLDRGRGDRGGRWQQRPQPGAHGRWPVPSSRACSAS